MHLFEHLEFVGPEKSSKFWEVWEILTTAAAGKRLRFQITIYQRKPAAGHPAHFWLSKPGRRAILSHGLSKLNETIPGHKTSRNTLTGSRSGC